MLRRLTIFLFLIAISTSIFAQKPNGIRGKLINKKTGEPVGLAGIYVAESDYWTASDDNGSFLIKTANNPLVSVEISCLGYETYSGKFSSSLLNLNDSVLVIRMVPTSYDMDEVTVLAKNSNRLATSTALGSAAIEYVQPASLADVMQLLPGNISANPDFTKAQKISIREIGVDNNSAMGTAILVDGAPISNNANLQTFSTLKTDDNFITTAGSGLDLRQFSADNIESIEFVKGIPSVVYGDLTSGAVLVKTKAGYTPWEAKLKTDAGIKQFAIGKGFTLKSKSKINFNFEYLQSYNDLRSKYTGFNRVTADFGFSKLFTLKKSLLTYNAKLSWYGTVDDEKKDPDVLVKNEVVKSENRGVRLNMYGKWSPKLRFLTNLDYSLSVSYAHQISSEERYRSSGEIQKVSTSMTEGENFGVFLPSEQLSNYVVDGKPLNVFLQLTATKISNFHHGVSNKLLYGFDYRLDGNYGDGQIFDLANPPFVSTYKSRPRKFSDIPALQNLSFYFEEKLSVLMGKTVLDVLGGLRLDNFQPSGLLTSKLGFYTEPRFNVQYSFLSEKNNQVFDKMAVRFGVGKTCKSPSLYYLYPDKAYFDLNALSYYVGNPDLNMSVINTQIFDTANKDLKPAGNLKLEAGLIFKIKKVSATITAFRERLSNGFDFTNQYLFLKYDKYQISDIPPGTRPNIATLPKISETVPVFYRMPVNNQESVKKGVEFSFEFGKVNALHTSFTLDGAWLRTTHILSTVPYQYQPASTTANPYLYYGVYPAGESKQSERLNTNLRMITQIPSLRMIFSSTFQVVWYDMYYFPKYEETPTYLVFSDGSKKEYTGEMKTMPEYMRFVNPKPFNYFLKETMPPVLQTNFRLSKEILDKLKLSVYVNNLFNYRPEYELKRTGSFIRRNPSLYFGAEIKIIL